MGLTAPQCVSIVGLGLDIIGVILLYKFGVNRNPKLSPYGHTTSWIEGNGLDSVSIKKYWLYWSLESLGLIALITGFGMQALGIWMQ